MKQLNEKTLENTINDRDPNKCSMLEAGVPHMYAADGGDNDRDLCADLPVKVFQE